MKTFKFSALTRGEQFIDITKRAATLEAAKKKNWTDILTTQNPFDCIIETYDDLIEIIENLPLKRQPHYQPFIDEMNNQGSESERSVATKSNQGTEPRQNNLYFVSKREQQSSTGV